MATRLNSASMKRISKDRLTGFSRSSKFPSVYRITIVGAWLSALPVAVAAVASQGQTRSSTPDNDKIEAPYRTLLKQTESHADYPRSVHVHSQRGDAHFFCGEYDKAVQEYQGMVKLNEELDQSHWRLGIALFFANKSDAAFQQFEKYHSFDDVDRENGIWRYLSQFRATDAATAQRELLRYQKDDREPFPAVYRLFDETISPAEAVEGIRSGLSEGERDKRLFYTELYIGMHMVVKKNTPDAVKYLERAVGRKWPQRASGGPKFMWHVARVQLRDLRQKDPQTAVEKDDSVIEPTGGR